MALRVVVESLSEEEIAGLREMFMVMDTKNSRGITFDELKSGLRRYSLTFKDTEIRYLMDAVRLVASVLGYHSGSNLMKIRTILEECEFEEEFIKGPLVYQSDSYQETGCYNLLCSGFVQTTNKIAIGAAISPTSVYGREQFDITLLVWKDPKHGHWWLEFGSGLLIGYWPSSLFSHLARRGTMIQFGGEIFNARTSSFHTSTQMGSGRFAREEFRRAAYFRNMQVVDSGNSLIPLSNIRVLADHPACYDIRAGVNVEWGNYFYYGGPGKNVHCP